MGALRAVECSGLGMKGIGWVYEQFALGQLTADDEVALLFEPLTGRPVSIPLVNLRWAASLCVEDRLLTQTEACQVIALAEAASFRCRTEENLSNAADHGACGEAMSKLLQFMRANPTASDRKRMDALMLLRQLGGGTRTLNDDWALPSCPVRARGWRGRPAETPASGRGRGQTSGRHSPVEIIRPGPTWGSLLASDSTGCR